MALAVGVNRLGFYNGQAASTRSGLLVLWGMLF